ncbi:MAG: patatin-like phospholipase family protein [Candidatus Hydrogenedentota bacterium]
MKKEDIRNQLRGLQALQGLAPSFLDEIAELGVERTYARDSIVISEGQVVEHFFVILGGRLLAHYGDKVVSHMERGDTFGQLSLMAEVPSLVTVKVRHDARLLHVPRNLFRKALASSPEFAAQIFKGSAARLATINQETRTRQPVIVAVHSAPAGVGKTKFAINLACAMAAENAGRVPLVDVATEKKRFIDIFGFGGSLPLVDLRDIETSSRDAVREKTRKHDAGFEILRLAHRGSSASADQTREDEAVAPLLSSLSRTFHYIVTDLPPVMDATVWKFLTHADTAIILTSAEPVHLAQTANLLGKLPGKARVLVTRATTELEAKRETIDTALGQRVDEFLEELPEGDEIAFISRPGSRYASAVRRLARGILGRLVGLALSGGAARGMAHIGVLKVLEEEGIRPDIIAGTSMGALIGGMWASGSNAAVLERIARRIRRSEFFSIFDLALPPSSGLLRGTKVDHFIRGVFGQKRFCDLLIPLRVIATDIDTGDHVVFDHGSVADAVRSSVAIPGILKPNIVDGRRLTDGAVIAPVPVDTLREAGVSRIIAVNAIPTAECFRDYSRSAIQPAAGRSDFLARLFHFSTRDVPSLLDIIVRSNQFMEAAIAEHSCQGASVIIRPWLPELHWMDFDSAPRFIESGVKAAREAMPEIREMMNGG